jgi:hypothetical protein
MAKLVNFIGVDAYEVFANLTSLNDFSLNSGTNVYF